MKPNPIHRLPAPLEAAVQRLKLAAREATERTIESLGLAALAATHAFQRDGLLGAQFELNRKSAMFALAFNEAFDERVLRELGPQGAPGNTGNAPLTAAQALTNWDALSLVEDREVEAQISAERFGMEISVACEWELRELNAYVGALLADAGGDRDRNPLRPDIVGHAMIKGIETVSEREEIRKILAGEMSRSLGGLLRTAYTGIVGEWRNAGVQPLGMAVRHRAIREAGGGYGDSGDTGTSAGSHFGGHEDERHLRGRPGMDSRYGGSRHTGGGFAPSSRTGFGSGRSGTPIGQVDPALMSLIRRLAHNDPIGYGSRGDDDFNDYADAGHGHGHGGHAPLPNLIRTHREELRQASTGSLDHMVIDVIGFLFDQILADPKVPPQMARQIARLQLPVLRAALGDPTFFSSRRHPVRRFVNRIASLGAGFEDFNDEGAKSFLAKVKALVQEVVEGDFDQIETYDQKLAALEAFVAEQSTRDVQAQSGASALLSAKEDEFRLRQLYAQRLAGDLKDVSAPAFLRDFVSRIWSQVLLRATERGGADGDQAQRLRRVGRELILSVHPKATPALRKAFLGELPKLMQELTEGMNLIGWPEAQRRAFFGQLMPAHAEALKSVTGRQLDINLMARKVEGALQRALPSRDELRAAAALPVLLEEISPPQFSAEEAQRVGLVEEAAVDWSQPVPARPDAVQAAAEAAENTDANAALPVAPGLPGSSEPPEPTQGKALADNVQIGFAYQMNIDGNWHKVRLSHVSAARSFFIFTYGGRHQKTVSLTQRMLVRLCETERLKAFEAASLIERATSRARRQLAALSAAQAQGGARAY
jgi:hypothetical protein